jgi:hypothetical protein
MPRGLNRSGDFRNGTPITLPHEFGTPITEPHDFGNDVTWTPDPAHFGNPVTLPHEFGNVIGGVTPPPPTPTQPTPTFSPVAGSYAGTQNITITSLLADTIYYTLNGSTPDVFSSVYSGPVAVSVSETLKAFAVRAGYLDSAVGVAAYTITPPPTPTLLASTSFAGPQTGGAGVITTPAIDTTGATLLVAICSPMSQTGSLPVITDSAAGNTWLPCSPNSGVFSTDFPFMYYVSSPTTSAAHTVSVNWPNGNFAYSSIIFLAFDGTAAVAAFEGQVSASSTTHGGAITPGNIGDLVISTANADNNFQASPSFNIDSGFIPIFMPATGENGNGNNLAAAYKVVASVTAVNPAWSGISTNGTASYVANQTFAHA